MATLADLVKIHSHRAELLIGYLKHTEGTLAGNPLLQRFGRSLDALRVPLRVVPHEPVRDVKEVRARDRLRSKRRLEEERSKEEQVSVQEIKELYGSADSYFEGRLEDERSRQEPDATQRQIYAYRGAEIIETQPEPLADLEPKLQLGVILGDPGSGKTEWLKHLARSAARDVRRQIENFEIEIDACCLPLFVHLSLVARAFQDRDMILEIRQCCLKETRILTEAEQAAAAILAALISNYQLPQALAPWMWDRFWRKTDPARSPPFLLCLDAWDEVRSGHDRLAPALRALASATSVRIFMTSRIIGYSHEPLPIDPKPDGPRRELRICPFEWAETEKFVLGFFQGDEEDKGRVMLQELRDKHAVAGMAQNPLLITLLCLAYVPNRNLEPLSLPLRRVEVYSRVLDGLLGTWVRDDEARGRAPVSPALVAAKRRLLSAMAKHFFPDELLSAEAIDDWWAGDDDPYLKKLDPDDPLRAWFKEHDGKLADALCHDAALVPCGNGYAFIHLTFQEYLVAYALARQARALADQKGPQNWNAIAVSVDKKAWLPEWEEVIVLLAGLMKDPSPLLEMLANPEPIANNPTGDDYFRHRLALAGLCLIELSENIRRAHADLFDRVSANVLDLWWHHRLASTADAAFALYKAVSNLIRINVRWGNDGISNRLATLLRDGSDHVSIAAAKAVGTLGPLAASREVVRELLVQLVNRKEHLRTGEFAKTLIRIRSSAIPGIREALIERSDDKDRYDPEIPILLGRDGLGAEIPPDLNMLVELLGDEWSPTLEIFVENVLGDRQTTLRKYRIHSRANDLATVLREYAVKTLGALGPAAATPAVLVALVKLLGDRKSTVPQYVIVETLRAFGSAAATSGVIIALVELLYDRRFEVWEHAAKALRAIVPTPAQVPPSIRDVLVEQVRDRDWYRTRNVIEGFGPAAATPEVLNVLVELLRDRQAHVRAHAAGTLPALGSGAATPVVINALVDQLAESGWCYEHESAIDAIRALGPMSAPVPPTVLKKLGELIHYADDKALYTFEALRILGSASTAVPSELLDELVERLGSSRHRWPLEDIPKILGALGPAAATPEVLHELVNLLGDRDDFMRKNAARALGKLGSAAAKPAVIWALVKRLYYNRKYARHVSRKLHKLRKDYDPMALPELELDGVAKLRPRSHPYEKYIETIHGTQDSIAKAIGLLGREAVTPAVLNALATQLGDRNEFVRRGALKTIGELGSVAAKPTVISALAKHIGSADWSKDDIIDMLKKLGPEAAVPEILDWLIKELATASDEIFPRLETPLLDVLAEFRYKAATPGVLSALIKKPEDQVELEWDQKKQQYKALTLRKILGQRLRLLNTPSVHAVNVDELAEDNSAI